MYAAVRVRAQKMIVGGGWSGSSEASALEGFRDFDDFDFLEDLVVSGGARRMCVMDSGGLHSRW